MLKNEERKLLKNIAYESIDYGLQHGEALAIDLSVLSPSLREQRASFVTLKKNNQLRGCIGNLQANYPLAQDISENSYAAAFHDVRFPNINYDELVKLDIHLSVLSPVEPILCQSEAELTQQLRPKIDGLILDDGFNRATFLPQVWQTLQDPTEFIQHLKRKAGLPLDYWSDEIKAFRYTSESF